MEEKKDKDNTAQKIPSSSKKEGHNEDSEEQQHGGQRRAGLCAGADCGDPACTK
jgi:hypothetical protein